MAVEGAAVEPARRLADVDFSSSPAAIEVRGLRKSFRIPTHRIDSLKERALHPFTAREYRTLEALKDISFEVSQGEFFGIVGRNGSGKSTLLKILASIYRADGGSIRMAGRLAPFIELGVGFNPELTARENVVLNGVMMGLSPGETRRRLDAVLEFAELEEFIDLKLKNYSSGMLVRLAFSTMIQADADVMLIDEVLAVGDAAFQQKCSDVFRDMREAGKTIVFVTHDMGRVEEYCHRAILLHDGVIKEIGDPAQVGRSYLRINFGHVAARTTEDGESPGAASLLDIWLEDDAGGRTASVEQGKEMTIRALVEAHQDIPQIKFGFSITNAEGLHVTEFPASLDPDSATPPGLSAGERALVSITTENPLAAGRYFVHFGVARRVVSDAMLYVPRAMDFMIVGAGRLTGGVIALEHRAEAVAYTEEEG